MNAYFDAWRRCFDYRGRSTRSQFWLYTLVFACLLFGAAFIDISLGADPEGLMVFAGIVNLAHILPGLAVTIRRLHDSDRSGWWFFIILVPLVGLIVLLVFMCTSSTPGMNRFGRAGTESPHSSPQMPAGSAQAAVGSSHLDQLEKLATLRSSGAIDDAEFERMKADLLSRSRG